MTYRPPAHTPSPSLRKFSIGDREVLQKRVKANPRYAGVTSRTNTGFNTHRRKELDREIRKYYKVRKDEEFRRISLSDLIQLMVTYTLDKANDEEEEEDKEEEEEEEEERKTHRFPLKYQDELKEIIHGMGDLMANTIKPAPIPPYVIIDIRTHAHFAASHLATAFSHPSHKLSRAVGWESGCLLSHKNRSDTVIVLCDECEDLSPQAASILQHRGYVNVYLLSGGLRLAQDKIGFPLVTDSCDTELPITTAIALQEKLTNVAIPPLSVTNAEKWWTSATTNTAATAAAAPTTRSFTSRSADPPPVAAATTHRPPPWR